jgi:prolyl 4-hydroxylase
MPLQPLGNRQKFYEDFMSGCRKFFGAQGPACDSVEVDRISMSLLQPRGMVNYTDTGFKKIKCPPKMYKLIKDFYDENKGGEKKEQWFVGNTYTNHWDAPTYMVSFEDTRLRGAGDLLKRKLWNMARETMQEWTGQEVTECSLYGVRVYKEGALLSTHVDRLPLVSSAIINVDQDVDEPWPIEVIGHDGKAHNVTMEPGDMVLYESHSVLHGRPFPLKGRFYANVFIHFEPIGHSLRHHGIEPDDTDVNDKYKMALAAGQGGHENDANGMPSYILHNSEEERRWQASHPSGKRSDRSKPASFTTGSTEAHLAARDGDVNYLSQIAKNARHKLTLKDENGWQPLHEAARGGHVPAVKFLTEHGSDVNERTNHGVGGTALYWVEKKHGKDHPLARLLKEHGGVVIEPEL